MALGLLRRCISGGSVPCIDSSRHTFGNWYPLNVYKTVDTSRDSRSNECRATLLHHYHRKSADIQQQEGECLLLGPSLRGLGQDKRCAWPQGIILAPALKCWEDMRRPRARFGRLAPRRDTSGFAKEPLIEACLPLSPSACRAVEDHEIPQAHAHSHTLANRWCCMQLARSWNPFYHVGTGGTYQSP